jgi:flagellin
MSLGVLNNISAIYAQNNLANTQASLSKTLQQLSSGSRINSGADDAAGLSLANGLQASATALTQSAKNASEGVDFLQTADGALAQVTSLLNRAVTLATEASNGTLNLTQQAATQAEYSSILSEINTIGSNTEYNGINVFSNASNIFTSDGTSSQSYATTALAAGGFNAAALGLGGTTLNVVVGTTQVGTGTGTKDALGNTIGASDLVLTDASAGNAKYNLTAMGVKGASTSTTTISYSGSLGNYAAEDITGSDIAKASVIGTDYAGNAIAVSDYVYTDASGNTYDLGATAATKSFAPTAGNVATSLGNATSAAAALTKINQAITAVAADRGTLGANINTLTAVGNVMTTQSTNTLAAMNDVTATDYGQATSDMSKYQILSQTGIAALSQANQAQQLITKLLQ